MDSTTFPWLKHLPEDEQDDFFQEIMALGSAGVDMGWGIQTFVEKLEAHIAAWKATAEVWANPEVLAALTAQQEKGDFVEAPRPEAPPVELLRQYQDRIRQQVRDAFGVDENYELTVPLAKPRLLDCGLCHEEDGEEVHSQPECTWVSPQYKKGSIIRMRGSIGWSGLDRGSRRWEVVEVLNAHYRVRALFTAYNEPEVSTWEFGLCHAATLLEWQKTELRQGVIGANGISRVPQEAKSDDE